MPSRFVYHERLRTSRLPKYYRLLGLVLFGTSDVIPDRDRVDRFEEYLMEGDADADAAARDLFAPDAPHAKNFRLMRDVLAGKETDRSALPDSFNDIIDRSAVDPHWLDRAKLESGTRVCRRLGIDAMSVLGDLALLGGYANPDISKPLAFTGQLQGERTFDRLSETSQFWFDVTRPGAMEVGRKGYTSAIRVRMMHAVVRQRLIAHPKWDSDRWGLPINQADSLSTNVAFSMAMIYGVRMLGYKLTNEEIDSVLHLWKYVGHLMGDDTDWLPDNVAEGLQCLFLINLSNANRPDDDSVSLAHDYLDSFRPEKVPGYASMAPDMKLLRHFIYWKHRAYAEYLIPRNLFRRLELPETTGSWLLIPLLQRPAIQLSESVRRIFPAVDEWMADRNGRKQAMIIKLMMGEREAEFVPVSEMRR